MAKAFHPDVQLCLYKLLTEYIERTRSVRSNSQLLISFQKPYKEVSTDTISRWLKTILQLAGLEHFSGYSTREASSSAATRADISIDAILEAAGWTNATTFQKYYNKPLRSENHFGHSLLQASIS